MILSDRNTPVRLAITLLLVLSAAHRTLAQDAAQAQRNADPNEILSVAMRLDRTNRLATAWHSRDQSARRNPFSTRRVQRARFAPWFSRRAVPSVP